MRTNTPVALHNFRNLPDLVDPTAKADGSELLPLANEAGPAGHDPARAEAPVTAVQQG
jgi:hypothetical protein